MIPGIMAKALNETRINGRIKVYPEDFVVAEILKKGLSFKEGRHLLAIAEAQIKNCWKNEGYLNKKIFARKCFQDKDKGMRVQRKSV